MQWKKKHLKQVILLYNKVMMVIIYSLLIKENLNAINDILIKMQINFKRIIIQVNPLANLLYYIILPVQPLLNALQIVFYLLWIGIVLYIL